MLLILGPPRSGTSCVARILQSKFGFCVAHEYNKGPANPLGYFEDLAMLPWTMALIKDELKTWCWLQKFYKHHRGCSGFPAYKTCVPGLSLKQLNPTFVVRVTRNRDDNVKSFIKNYIPVYTPEQANNWLDKYEIWWDVYKTNLKHVVIDMSNHWEDETLIEFFKENLK